MKDQLYHIVWSPNLTQSMGGAGFCIVLYPAFKELASKSDLNEKLPQFIKNMEPIWLQNHGLDVEVFKRTTRGTWGEWGLEHFSVSGNACGLDIGESLRYENCMELSPHNVDSLRQASQLLTFFLKVVDYMLSEEYMRNMEKEEKTQ